jgi:hypothetical protein
MKELRINMEEIVIQGDECEQDVRMVNSYPSKVLVLARVVLMSAWSVRASFHVLMSAWSTPTRVR